MSVHGSHVDELVKKTFVTNKAVSFTTYTYSKSLSVSFILNGGYHTGADAKLVPLPSPFHIHLHIHITVSLC